MPIKGLDKHLKHLRAAKTAARDVVQGLYAAGSLIEADAERSITEGAVSGKHHVPSLPGQPPNEDTGHLRANIETEIIAGAAEPTVHVTSKARYAAYLEFGTSRMAARPYMRPATEKNREKVAGLVAEQVSVTIRRGGT